MRTALFVGLSLISDAIRGTAGVEFTGDTYKMVAIVFIFCAILDIVDVFRRRKEA
jgi:hypothetical protein